MKERFQKRLLSGKIKVSCKKNGKVVAIWESRKEDLIEVILHITQNAHNDGYSLSLRRVFYELLSRNLIKNYLEPYNKLSKIVGDMKYTGVLDWNFIKVDEARGLKIDYSVDNITDALEDTVDQYKLDRQEGQTTYIEVWSEKDTLVDVLKRITSKYHIPLCIVKGRNSSSAMYKAYQRFRERISQGDLVNIIYVGDHDPCGLDMIRDVRERISFMLDNSTLDYSTINWNMISTLDYKYALPEAFEVLPVALTKYQIDKYNLPANYAKETDNLYKWYVKETGSTECWEIDALDYSTLTGIVEGTICNLIDMDIYKEIIAKELKDKQALKDFIEQNEH